MLAVIPHRGCLWPACKNCDAYVSRRNEGYKNVMGQSMHFLVAFVQGSASALPSLVLPLLRWIFHYCTSAVLEVVPRR